MNFGSILVSRNGLSSRGSLELEGGEAPVCAGRVEVVETGSYRIEVDAGGRRTVGGRLGREDSSV